MRLKIGVKAGLAGILASCAIHGLAFAASFDCTHATSPQEKLICSDPALSDLDEQLGRTYQERRAALSPQGAELLQSSQRSWLRYVATVCAVVVPADDRRQNPKDCLERRYEKRLGQLAAAGQRLGPFLFNRVDVYVTKPAPLEICCGSAPGFNVHHVAYPQIDNPSSAEAEAWNKRNVRNLPNDCCCFDDEPDQDIDYEIYANRNIISLRWADSYYCHGAAHGSYSSKVQNEIVGPPFRPLTAQDIFGPADDWVDKLRQLFRPAFDISPWGSPPGDERTKNIWNEVQHEVVQPAHWQFTAEGLKVTFNEDDFVCRLCTPHPITIPWEELKPLLSQSAIIP